MKLTTETIHGVSVDIEVDSNGKFRADLGDDGDFRRNTLDELKTAITEALKKRAASKALPVTILGLVPNTKTSKWEKIDPYTSGIGFVQATLRGRHASQGQFLLTAEDGTKFQIPRYSHGLTKFARRLDLKAVMQWQQLAQAVADAQATLKAFEDEVTIDPEKHLEYGGGK